MDATLAVISLGSNDGGADTRASLEAVRSRVHADRVVWIAPCLGARAEVLAIAASYGDQVVSFTAGRDGVHPQSYPAIARQVLRGDKP